jgi:hypothetical protein
MLAGDAGAQLSETGLGEAGVETFAKFGDGAWHDPPHPQSNPRADAGAAIESPFGCCSPDAAFTAAEVDAGAMSPPQTIDGAPPSSEPTKGS